MMIAVFSLVLMDTWVVSRFLLLGAMLLLTFLLISILVCTKVPPVCLPRSRIAKSYCLLMFCLGFLCVSSGVRLACSLPSSYYLCLVLLAELCQCHEVLWEISPLFLLFERVCIDENYLFFRCSVELTCKLDLVFFLWEDF